MKAIKHYQSWLMASLKDPIKAELYLNEALNLGDTEFFLQAVRNVAEAHAEEIQNVSGGTFLKTKSPNQILSNEKDPDFDGLDELLDALGFKIVIQSKKSSSAVYH